MDKKQEPQYHYPSPERDQRYLIPPYQNDYPIDFYTGASMSAMGFLYQAQYPVLQQDIVKTTTAGYNQPNPRQQQKSKPSIPLSSTQVQHPTQISFGNGGAYSNHIIAPNKFNAPAEGGDQQNSQAYLYPTSKQMRRSAPDNPGTTREVQQQQQQSSGFQLFIPLSNSGASTSSGTGADNKRKRASSRTSTQTDRSKRQRKGDSDSREQEPQEDGASAPEDAPDEPDDEGDEDGSDGINDEYEEDEDEDDKSKGKGKRRARKSKTEKKKKADGPGRACVRCKDKNRPCSFVSRLRSTIKKRDVCDGCEEAKAECIHVTPDIPRGPWPGWAHCPRLLELLRQDDEKLLYRWCSQMLLKSHLTPAGFKGTNFDYLKTDEAALTGKGWSLSAMSVAINSGKKRHLPETVTPSRRADSPVRQGLSESMVLDPTKTQEKQKMEWKRRIAAMRKEHEDDYDYTNEDETPPTVMSTPPSRHQQDEYRLVLDIVNRRSGSANNNFKVTRASELQLERDVIQDWLETPITDGHDASDSDNARSADQQARPNWAMSTTGSDGRGAIVITPDTEGESANCQIAMNQTVPEKPEWGWIGNAEPLIDPSLPDWSYHGSQYSDLLLVEDADEASPFWN